MRHPAFAGDVTRDDLLTWYRANRARTRELFDMVVPDAYYDRPIALRNPIVFYEGHLPAFSVNTLVKLAGKRQGIDERLEVLFARGIDPEDEAAVRSPTEVWPSREEVQAYGRAADALVEEALTEPSEAAFTILEHEGMHQETLLYMLHELGHEKKRRDGWRLAVDGWRENVGRGFSRPPGANGPTFCSVILIGTPARSPRPPSALGQVPEREAPRCSTARAECARVRRGTHRPATRMSSVRFDA